MKRKLIYPGKVVASTDLNSVEYLTDLLDEYKKAIPAAFRDRFLIAGAKNLIKSFEANDNYADYQINYVVDISEAIKIRLNDYAPDFMSLGEIHDSGEKVLGWYVDTSDVERAVEDGEITAVNDLNFDRKKITTSLVLHVNDHHNWTLYTVDKKNKLQEIWAIV